MYENRHNKTHIEEFYNWSTINFLQESSKAFYLYIDTNMAISIPKKCFTSKTEIERFETYVKDRLINIQSFLQSICINLKA